ncbi:SDR family NAD(P)-dependent oxidoreductase [Actinomycetospora endophytica]|uniref:SDR family NAD(P)-dependent oxidoreductase n=1 Tax=Actinomycetospora endophytica TaxID=2291215 RepID=A0ABS8P9S9_9PSEU|nr:SDR family NAD(P)-dependent oxidoreductase [Actinomycetospora endophytica]MCD2194773.1 SDR family NAD(P)-dependent oxidoreductase [Actinomycetospora endophytica]
MIIVGVGPGLGTAVARRFAREGFVVGLIARSEATLTTAAAALGDDVTTWTRTADATDEAALKDALAAFVGTHGVPDAVVYNAAIIRQDEPGELDQAAMLDTYAVNVVGAITTAGVLLPRMTGGSFVITSGMPTPLPGLTSLSLGKVGVRGLVEILTGWQDRVHVASVTVGGPVASGTDYDPDEIAEHYWRLHTREVTDHEVRHG